MGTGRAHYGRDGPVLRTIPAVVWMTLLHQSRTNPRPFALEVYASLEVRALRL